MLFDLFKNLEPRHDWHIDVEQNQVGIRMLVKALQGFESIFSLDQLRTVLLHTHQHEVGHLVDQSGIVYDEYSTYLHVLNPCLMSDALLSNLATLFGRFYESLICVCEQPEFPKRAAISTTLRSAICPETG